MGAATAISPTLDKGNAEAESWVPVWRLSGLSLRGLRLETDHEDEFSNKNKFIFAISFTEFTMRTTGCSAGSTRFLFRMQMWTAINNAILNINNTEGWGSSINLSAKQSQHSIYTPPGNACEMELAKTGFEGFPNSNASINFSSLSIGRVSSGANKRKLSFHFILFLFLALLLQSEVNFPHWRTGESLIECSNFCVQRLLEGVLGANGTQKVDKDLKELLQYI